MILQYCGRCIIFFTNKFNIIFFGFIMVPVLNKTQYSTIIIIYFK